MAVNETLEYLFIAIKGSKINNLLPKLTLYNLKITKIHYSDVMRRRRDDSRTRSMACLF